MASKPYFDAARGAWRMKYWAGAERGWVAVQLGKQPGPRRKGDAPKKPPPEVEMVARKYRDLEVKARHGVAVATVRGHDLGAYLDAYRAQFAAGCAPGSLPNIDRAIRLFKAHCAAAGVKTAEAVTTAHCRAYLTGRAQSVGWNTLRTEKGLLAPAWTQLRLDGAIGVNPWEAAPVPGRPKAEAPPYWSREELARLVAACDGWLRDLVLVGANCGLRIDALLGLEWRDVDFTRGVIVCRAGASKSSRRYEVPMSATANEVLARRWLAVRSGQVLVFPRPRSGKRMKSSDPYGRLKVAVRRAKLPDRGHYNHCLRHTFASHAVMAGVPLAIVSAWLGHHSIKQTECYSHLCKSEIHRHMEGFDLGAPPQPPSADGPGSSSS